MIKRSKRSLITIVLLLLAVAAGWYAAVPPLSYPPVRAGIDRNLQELATQLTAYLLTGPSSTKLSKPAWLKHEDRILVTLYCRGQEPRRLTIHGIDDDIMFMNYADIISRAVREMAPRSPDRSSLPIHALKVELLTGKSAPVRLLSPLLLHMVTRHGCEGYIVRTDEAMHIVFPTESIERGLAPMAALKHLVADTRKKGARLERFTTQGGVYLPDDATWTVLSRNQPLPTRVTREAVWNAVIEGGDFLVRHQDGSGRFGYEYDSMNDNFINRYNILRHCGTAFSLYQLAAVSGEQRFLTAADKAVSWLMHQGYREEGDIAWVLDGHQAKLGGMALFLLSLTEREALVRDARDRVLMEKLARGIIACMSDSGELASYYDWSTDHEVPSRVSIYYPGEAVFALNRLAQIDRDGPWLDAAIRAADFLIARGRLAGMYLSAFPDAWLLCGLAELFEMTGEDRFRSAGSAIVRQIIAEQYQPGDNEVACLGAAFDPVFPRSTPTAARAEGLSAYYRVLLKRGLLAEAALLREHLLDSAMFQLSQQSRRNNSFFVKYPERANGGFFASSLDRTMRIDYTQHNLSALITMLTAIEDWS